MEAFLASNNKDSIFLIELVYTKLSTFGTTCGILVDHSVFVFVCHTMSRNIHRTRCNVVRSIVFRPFLIWCANASGGNNSRYFFKTLNSSINSNSVFPLGMIFSCHSPLENTPSVLRRLFRVALQVSLAGVANTRYPTLGYLVLDTIAVYRSLSNYNPVHLDGSKDYNRPMMSYKPGQSTDARFLCYRVTLPISCLVDVSDDNADAYEHLLSCSPIIHESD